MNFSDELWVSGVSIAVCLTGLLVLLWVLRKDGPSFALPFAYLALLLVNHVPGAFVPLVDHDFFGHLSEVTTGIRLTAIGVVAFVTGVWFARRNTVEQRIAPQSSGWHALFRGDRPFWLFCLLGGWLFTFGLTPLRNLPSIGAVIYNGGAIWMLGVILGLRWAFRNKRRKLIFFWLGCLAVYPSMILVTAGFLSYGVTAALVGVCCLTVVARRYWMVFVTIGLVGYLGLSVFSNYFQARDNIRNAVWAGATMERRIDAIAEIFRQWHFFSTQDKFVLVGLDIRLNQNFFVGLAAENLDNGTTQYLYGSSVTDAVLALIPRALWPNKTVFGGSPEIVSRMTGMELDTNTSFGVGNVMEFYISFGIAGLIGGFLLLGWALGRFDHRAALAEGRGDYGTALMFFLPGVALIQPIGSIVELAGSASSAWIAACFWKWAWARWQERQALALLRSPGATSP